VTPLSNGVPVTGLSGASGQQSMFSIAVPAGQTQLTVTISGGTGDADLYVRAGSQPDLTTFDCRPFITGNAETCTFQNPAATTWFVMLNGFTQYSGVTLTATFSSTSTGPQLLVKNIHATTGHSHIFSLVVPAGQSTLTIQISGGTGDADLYVRKNVRPTLSKFDCRPLLSGNNEVCTFANPVAATYDISVRATVGYTGVTLTGQYQ
jgi:hypothetical protein